PLTGALADRAISELDEALKVARVSRLERLHLSDEEVAVARGLLMSLGAPPMDPVEGEALEPK
ncbi:hypothetical protein HY251_13985, partial [bacterium]|nr:hypothetical protein [bacterium]